MNLADILGLLGFALGVVGVALSCYHIGYTKGREYTAMLDSAPYSVKTDSNGYVVNDATTIVPPKMVSVYSSTGEWMFDRPSDSKDVKDLEGRNDVVIRSK